MFKCKTQMCLEGLTFFHRLLPGRSEHLLIESGKVFLRNGCFCDDGKSRRVFVHSAGFRNGDGWWWQRYGSLKRNWIISIKNAFVFRNCVFVIVFFLFLFDVYRLQRRWDLGSLSSALALVALRKFLHRWGHHLLPRWRRLSTAVTQTWQTATAVQRGNDALFRHKFDTSNGRHQEQIELTLRLAASGRCRSDMWLSLFFQLILRLQTRRKWHGQ